MFDLKVIAIACVAAASVGFGAGWFVNGAIKDSTISGRDTTIANMVRDHALALQSATTDVLTAERQAAADLARKDAIHQEQLANEKVKIDKLERLVAAGPKRLYIAAKCPASKPVSTAATATGVDSGAVERPELDSAARPDYFAVRRGIIKLESALKLCVDASAIAALEQSRRAGVAGIND